MVAREQTTTIMKEITFVKTLIRLQLNLVRSLITTEIVVAVDMMVVVVSKNDNAFHF